MNLSILKLIASCDGCHAWSRRRLLNLEHLVVLLAGPISHTSIRCMDFVEIFNIILDLSITCFSRFSGCWASFMFIVITLSWNAITCFLESSWVWDRFLLLLGPHCHRQQAGTILCLQFYISLHLSFSYPWRVNVFLAISVPHAVFLAHIAYFSLELSLVIIMHMAVVCRPKFSGQLFAFHTWTIYKILIFQLCTVHFSTTALIVLGIRLLVFLFFGIYCVSLCKHRYPYKDNLLLYIEAPANLPPQDADAVSLFFLLRFPRFLILLQF